MDPRTTDAEFLEVLDAHFEAYFQKFHAPIIGLVNSYDDTTQRADVMVVVRLRVEGSEVAEPYICRGVSVCFPGGGGISYSWPLATGDGISLIPQDADVGGYLSSGTVSQLPQSTRRFSLSDALGFPLVARPQGAVLPAGAVAADGGVLYGKHYVGSSAATKAAALDQDAVAMATLMAAWMGQVEVAVNGLIPGLPDHPLSTTFTKIGEVQATATKLVAE